MTMKRLVLMLVLCAAGSVLYAQEKDSLLVMFWNVENFFDWTDQGTGESDKEFSSYGTRRWTRKRFYIKCDAIAKSILWTGDRYGRIPDVIGLAEIENKGVLTKLLNSTLLRKYDYSIIHHESGDRRGIDVALIYRNSSMTHISTTVLAPESDGVPMNTRDILHAGMRTSDGDTVDFIVNHHPSKYGGAEESSQRRNIVMSSLKSLCDSLYSSRHKDRIVVMGDFNDTPDAPQFSIMDGMVNHGLDPFSRREGSIRYKGKWELIDMFMTSEYVNTSDMDIVQIPFLMTYEKGFPGMRPLRTYSGPRYIGGVSDHCPVVMVLHD